jgi:eukaryotic-like serine/threonine-protein kinase
VPLSCPKCATPLEAGARFCGVCGNKLEDKPAAAAPARPAPADRVDGAATQIDKPALKLPLSAHRPAVTPAPVQAPKPPPVARATPKPIKPEDPYIGSVLNGRFTIEAKLGEGGFGAVYKGVQNATGRRVAIKLLHPEMTRDQNVVARFRREGQVLCALRDAHTITTYDFDQTPDGTLFIAMELLQGKSLHEIFHEEAPIAWQRMLKVMAEMCSSLEEAHAIGIVHRDLKPENVYLENRPGNPEFVKILDFGIAKVMRGDGIAGDMSPQLTATGQTLGTLEYMSPEQLMGKQLDGRSDIYGLGVVAFELITGRLPFPDAVGPAALISAQLKKVPPTPSQAYPQGDIPEAVDQLIFKMLEKDKNNRFRDATELRREIDGILSTMAAPVRRADRASQPNLSPQVAMAAPAAAPGQVQAAWHGDGSGPVHVPGAVAYGPPASPSASYRGGPVMVAGGTPAAMAHHQPTPVPPASGQVQAPYQGGGTEPVHFARQSSKGLWIFIIVLAILAAGGAVAGYLAMK